MRSRPRGLPGPCGSGPAAVVPLQAGATVEGRPFGSRVRNPSKGLPSSTVGLAGHPFRLPRFLAEPDPASGPLPLARQAPLTGVRCSGGGCSRPSLLPWVRPISASCDVDRSCDRGNPLVPATFLHGCGGVLRGRMRPSRASCDACPRQDERMPVCPGCLPVPVSGPWGGADATAFLRVCAECPWSGRSRRRRAVTFRTCRPRNAWFRSLLAGAFRGAVRRHRSRMRAIRCTAKARPNR
jgi:hypothetical protein